MRMARIKFHGRTAVYHCISRIVGGQFLLDDLGKEKLRLFLRQHARFCGVQVLTHCEMTNHFHVLVRVPPPENISDHTLLERALALYGPRSALVGRLSQALKARGRIPEQLRNPLIGRMGDVSIFMQELKQRFSRWYNQQHQRYGTLWAERFKSLAVEDQPGSLSEVAAYIDLNSIRAAVASDPAHYRWCGYAQALGGDAEARAGLCSILQREDWQEAAAAYRQLLYVSAAQPGHSAKAAADPEVIRKVVEQGGEISKAQALRLRIRYFTDGVALGSEAFINEVFAEFRDRFSAARKTGPRKLRRLPFDCLRNLRALRVKAYG